MTLKRTIAVLAAVLLALAGAAAPAAAKSKRPKRIVPKYFYGMNFDEGIKRFASYEFRKTQFLAMRRDGAETVRASIDWAWMQPREDQLPDWTESDRLVKMSVAYGLDLLPVVVLAPPWANNSTDAYVPPDPEKFDTFLRQLVERYGPKGAFWKENPKLRRKPIRKWQIWNEPNIPGYWHVQDGEDWAASYGALLRSSYDTIKEADPGAKVLMAALTNYAWSDLDHLYDAGGIHGYFDVAALDPYTAQRHGVVEIVRRYKAVLKKHGDAKRPLWVTELGLPASKGKTKDTSTLQTTDQGMASFLTESYKDLMKGRKRSATKVDRVYWYTWATIYYGDLPWHWAGLNRWDKTSKGEDMVEPKPARKAYRKIALRSEGVRR